MAPCLRFAPEPFLECRRCGFIFRDDLNAEELRQIYAQGAYEELHGEHYLAAMNERRRDARVRLRYLQPWARGGRLIDIGAAGGEFVAEANACGFDAAGIEPTPSFARSARERLGVDVRDGGIEDAELATESHEVITMWHVLEHLDDPVAQLRRLAPALSPDGVLALEVPNAGGETAAHMGSSWTSLQPAVHINQFTPSSLRSALERAGFALLDLRTTTITPYLRARARLHPRHLAGRAKAAAWLGDPRGEHPTGHELLRSVARRFR